MPASPEIGDAACDVRKIEIDWNVIPEEVRRASGDVGIAGEIKIDLQSESVGEEPCLKRAVGEVGLCKHVNEYCEVVCNEQLLC